MVGYLNEACSDPGHLRSNAHAFAPGNSLVDALRNVGVNVPPEVETFVGTWPSGLREAVRALLYENSTRENGTVPVTFAWAPGYDYEVSMWDVRDTRDSAGGITVLLRSRYPDDAHPLGLTGSA